MMHIGHQREELAIELEEKKLTQADSLVYLGGAVCGDGKTETEVRRSVHDTPIGYYMWTLDKPTASLSAAIARVTRADRRRMVELREETGVQRSLTERLVRSTLQWAGHVERMADDRVPKRASKIHEEAGGDEGGQG